MVADPDNKWYHYSTKLENNIKLLRKQIEDQDLKFIDLQNQLEQEMAQKEKLQNLNFKLTNMMKKDKKFNF